MSLEVCNGCRNHVFCQILLSSALVGHTCKILFGSSFKTIHAT